MTKEYMLSCAHPPKPVTEDTLTCDPVQNRVTREEIESHNMSLLLLQHLGQEGFDCPEMGHGVDTKCSIVGYE